jgi:hypothetical protein
MLWRPLCNCGMAFDRLQTYSFGDPAVVSLAAEANEYSSLPAHTDPIHPLECGSDTIARG